MDSSTGSTKFSFTSADKQYWLVFHWQSVLKLFLMRYSVLNFWFDVILLAVHNHITQCCVYADQQLAVGDNNDDVFLGVVFAQSYCMAVYKLGCLVTTVDR